MKSLRDQLSEVLTGKVCILGVGNRMRGDDAAGSLLAERLQGQIAAHCIDGGMAPENHLEQVVQAEPDTVLIVDAVDFEGQPGELRVFRPEEITSGGLSTHALSLQMACEYLNNRIPTSIYLVAVQPASVGLDETMSDQVSGAVKRLTEALSQCLPRVV